MSAGRIPFGIKITLGLVLFFGMFWIAMTFGAADTTIREVWNALTFGPLNEKAKIVQEIRLPRELAAILVGAALGVSGAIMQAMTRNPLADPGLLGLTAGANAALALVIVLFPKIEYFGIMIACFVGAALGAALVFGIGASKKGGFSPLRIVLAGSAISAFLYAIAEGIGIYFKIAQDVSQWTSGGLVGSTWGQLQVITPVIAIGIVIAFIFSRQLTILSLSEEVALGLGQNIQRIKAVLYVVVILLAGAAVALVGNMAFIGLMIPHIVRAIVGTDYRFILPMTAIFGATF
ncbi:TPA_asm: iron ABC transporter permease, partial [Salmonella enterica subsp. enterica serovar Enteritidis str. P125109]|nr:iron ABC transporter permease [Salmonella enterica subsp. enterica serovar Enteritidis str. P125109]